MGMEEFCVGHAVSILGSEPGRAAMRAHLKVAQTLLRKAKDNVRRLEAAIQEDDGCNFRTVPTLLLTQCGFDDGGGGPHSISAGTVPVALALREPLPTGSHETLCRTLVGKPLALTFCKDRRFLCDVELPADIVDRLAPVPEGRKEMRPGAVLYKTGPKELYFFLRRSASEKERAGCKLFGYIHKEGLDVLSWKHTGDCFLYRKGCHVELRFLKVKFLDGDTADSGDEDFHSDSSAESLQ
ncbi:uncharacterized protein LOC117648257 isoform X2 [Thrips palmi]|nr:uncharacterized protein LOC117648257 isoform X2 [Thrips palmi]